MNQKNKLSAEKAKKSEQKTIIVHKPVMVAQVLEYLDPKPDKVYLDVTFGSGGHTRAILEREPGCRVIAMDWDMRAIEQFGNPLIREFGDRLRILWGNFALLYKIFKKERIAKVDGILADFGTSQMHLKDRPGFSFTIDSALDMRMSPAHQPMTVEQVLATSSEEKLRQIFWQLGEERYAKEIAREIVAQRKQRRIRTTAQLADLVIRVVPHDIKQRLHPATRIFQALRMYVNKEFHNIESFLSFSTRILVPNGRIVCISFHSLEDRLVKQFFHAQAQAGVFQLITDGVIMPSAQEIEQNPSARSARLRAALKL